MNKVIESRLVSRSILFLLSSLEYWLYVWDNIGYCSLAVVYLQESEHNDHDFDYEDDDTNEDCEAAKSCFLIIEAAPDWSPVDDPDEVDDERNGHEVPQSCFLFDVGIVPKKEDECE